MKQPTILLFNRPDYVGRFTDLLGLISADEPVFLLRAADQYAPTALRDYATLIASQGAAQDFVDSVLQQAENMEAWQKAQGTGIVKMPDFTPATDGTAQPEATTQAAEAQPQTPVVDLTAAVAAAKQAITNHATGFIDQIEAAMAAAETHLPEVVQAILQKVGFEPDVAAAITSATPATAPKRGAAVQFNRKGETYTAIITDISATHELATLYVLGGGMLSPHEQKNVPHISQVDEGSPFTWQYFA